MIKTLTIPFTRAYGPEHEFPVFRVFGSVEERRRIAAASAIKRFDFCFKLIIASYAIKK
jgi:hypothetical protein